MRKKKILTAIWAVLLALLYFAIFGFSGQTGEESGSLSLTISEKCAQLVNAISGKNWTEQTLHSVALYFEHPIRKLAHFGEYAIMGVMVFQMLRPWVLGRIKERWKRKRYCSGKKEGVFWKNAGTQLYVIVVLWVFLSAAADELHQFFVPGRYCSFADVMLDTLGGFCGMLVCVLLGKLFRRRNR